jgi:hypothetical protein
MKIYLFEWRRHNMTKKIYGNALRGIGLLALAFTLGISIMGCPVDGTSENTDPKLVKITGITVNAQTASLKVLPTSGSAPVAYAASTAITGGEVTFTLYTGSSGTTAYTGAGTFTLELTIGTEVYIAGATIGSAAITPVAFTAFEKQSPDPKLVKITGITGDTQTASLKVLPTSGSTPVAYAVSTAITGREVTFTLYTGSSGTTAYTGSGTFTLELTIGTEVYTAGATIGSAAITPVAFTAFTKQMVPPAIAGYWATSMIGNVAFNSDGTFLYEMFQWSGTYTYDNVTGALDLGDGVTGVAVLEGNNLVVSGFTGDTASFLNGTYTPAPPAIVGYWATPMIGNVAFNSNGTFLYESFSWAGTYTHDRTTGALDLGDGVTGTAVLEGDNLVVSGFTGDTGTLLNGTYTPAEHEGDDENAWILGTWTGLTTDNGECDITFSDDGSWSTMWGFLTGIFTLDGSALALTTQGFTMNGTATLVDGKLVMSGFTEASGGTLGFLDGTFPKDKPWILGAWTGLTTDNGECDITFSDDGSWSTMWGFLTGTYTLDGSALTLTYQDYPMIGTAALVDGKLVMSGFTEASGGTLGFLDGTFPKAE